MTVISTDTDEVIRAVNRIKAAEDGIATDFQLLPSPSMLDFGRDYGHIVGEINGCRATADRLVKHSYGVRAELVKLDIAIAQSQGDGMTQEQYERIKSNLQDGPPVIQGKGVVADVGRFGSDWSEEWGEAKDTVFGAIAHGATEALFAVTIGVGSLGAATGTALGGGGFDVGKEYRQIDRDTRFMRKPIEEAVQVGVDTVLKANPIFRVVDTAMSVGGVAGDLTVAVCDHEGADAFEYGARSVINFGAGELVDPATAAVVDWAKGMGWTDGMGTGDLVEHGVVDGFLLITGDTPTTLKVGDWLDRTIFGSGTRVFGPGTLGSGPVFGAGGAGGGGAW